VKRDDATAGRVRVVSGTVQHAVLYAAGAPEWERKSGYAVSKEKVKKALEEYESRLKTLGPTRR